MGLGECQKWPWPEAPHRLNIAASENWMRPINRTEGMAVEALAGFVGA
jgi:hypothetical protein